MDLLSCPQVDSSIGKSTFPLWAIIACAVGGAVLVGVAGWLTWSCCCRASRGRPSAGSVSPSGGGASSYTYTHSPSSGGAPSGGYPTPGSTNGAWGYHHQQQVSPYTTNGYYTNGYGYANGAPNGHAPVAAAVVEDPIEQQRIALAMAASLREQQQGQGRGRRQTKTTAEAISEQQQLRLAMDASLQEQRRHQSGAAQDDDAQLRAAIEASLREQQRQRSWGGHWG